MTFLRAHTRAVAASAGGVVLALLITLLITQTGRSDVTDPRSGTHASVETLKAVLEGLPKPAGATLIEEHASGGGGDRATTVTRAYRITGAQPACAQLIQAAKGTEWIVQADLTKPLDPATCDPAVPNPDYTDPGNDKQRSGYLRRDGKPGTVHLEWRHDWLLYSLDEGNLPE